MNDFKNWITIFLLITTTNFFSQNDDLEVFEKFIKCDNYNGKYFIGLNKRIYLNNIDDIPDVVFLTSFLMFRGYQLIFIDRGQSQNYNLYSKTNNQDIFKRCEISANDTHIIKKLIATAITSSKYEQQIPGNDGVNYYFGVNLNEFITGSTWSPYSGKMYRLKEIGTELWEITENKKNGDTIKISKKTLEKIKKLTSQFEYETK